MTHYIENIHFSGKYRGDQPGKNPTTHAAGLSDLSHYLMRSDSLTDLVKRATYFIADLVKVKVCRIYLVDQQGHWFQPASEGAQLPEETWFGEDFSRKTKDLKNIFDLTIRTAAKPSKWNINLSSVEYAALGVPNGCSHWLIPLTVEKDVIGILFLGQPVSPEIDPFTTDASYVVDLVADQLANAIHRNQLNERLSNLSIETVLALSRTLDARDSHSGSHSKRMAGLSEKMAMKFQMSTRETRELCWAALLHDIGKIGVEDQILYKPGPLNDREWEIMKTHPEVGAQMVRGLSGMENIATLIFGHHERMDGSGYPRGLCGEQIPLGARIIAVVDSYSAMTEGRPYRQARTHDQAIMELNKLSGTQYDAETVNAFISLFEENSVELSSTLSP
jgi:putative nucleotidyltransferase with HDIG domain